MIHCQLHVYIYNYVTLVYMYNVRTFLHLYTATFVQLTWVERSSKGDAMLSLLYKTRHTRDIIGTGPSSCIQCLLYQDMPMIHHDNVSIT